MTALTRGGKQRACRGNADGMQQRKGERAKGQKDKKAGPGRSKELKGSRAMNEPGRAPAQTIVAHGPNNPIEESTRRPN